MIATMLPPTQNGNKGISANGMDEKLCDMQEKRQQMLKSRLMLHNPSRRRLLLSWTQHRDKSLAAHPMLLIYVVAKPQLKMRIKIYCPDINSYLENPKEFLPKEIKCLRDPAHKPHWHTGWWRFVAPDHVNKLSMPMFRLYCPDCKESISIWTEFILPYQPELIDTHELVVVENLNGKPIKEMAEELGYDPRSISRWIKRGLNHFHQVAF